MLEVCLTVVFITCTQILAERHTLRRINGLIFLPLVSIWHSPIKTTVVRPAAPASFQWKQSRTFCVIKSSTTKMTKQSAKTIQWRDKEKDKINVLNMMLNTKKDTDVHEFARQLKEHLGEECWVSIENRAPAGPGNLKLFEENNFRLPRDIRGLYSDTNGISLTWGTNSNPTTACGHLGKFKVDWNF